MKYTLFLFIIFSISLSAQTRNMTNTESARTYSVENTTRTVSPLLQRAEIEFRALDYDGAFLTLENAVAQNPNSVDALLMRAEFLRIVGRDREAQIDIKRANQINPLAADLYGLNGIDGQLKMLATEPEKAVVNQNARVKLAGYYQALDRELLNYDKINEDLFALESVIENLNVKKYDEAYVQLEAVMQNVPNSPLAHDLKGLILMERGDIAGAKYSFQKAIEYDSDFAMAYYNLASIEKIQGNFEETKRHLDKAISLQNNLSKAYFDRALVNKSLGKEDLAVEDYNSVVLNDASTSYNDAILNRGLTKKMTGDYTGAMRDFDSAIKTYPNNAKLYKNRGNVHVISGSLLNAIDDYTRAIDRNPQYAAAYYNRGLAFLLLHDPVSGCNDLNRSLDLGYIKATETIKYFCQ